MNKPKRILKKIDVSFISLVDKAANGKLIIFKSAAAPSGSPNGGENISKSFRIIKTDDEKRLVYGTVYEPDTVDSQGDSASAEVIEQAAHSFLAKLHNKNVDTQHDFVADDGAVVESFILRAADPMFPETKVGAWVVAIKIVRDETWDAIKKGEITGLSLAGMAAVEAPSDSPEGGENSLAKEFIAMCKRFFSVGKDFNAELKATELNQKVWALQDAIRKVMNDEATGTDQKQAAVLESIDQFRASVVSEPVSKTNQQGATMQNLSEEDLNKVVAKVNETLKPLSDQVKKIGEDITALGGRVEKMEKAPAGSKQVDDDPAPKVVKKRFFMPEGVE